jgi:ComF family protein
VGPLFGRIADLLLPPSAFPAASASAATACSAALASPRSTSSRLRSAPVSAFPLPYDAGEGSLSAAAIASPRVYDRARAAARYSDTMRELVQSFKYRNWHEGLPLFACWLSKAGAELLAAADLIVPVPLYFSRLWWRRFKQSAMLALALGRLTGIPVHCFVLKRVRRTTSLVGLSADQRRRNVAGAFKVDKARTVSLKGLRIVVVDDVITTGATAEAYARVLKRAKAARVDVLARARAVEPTAFVL